MSYNDGEEGTQDSYPAAGFARLVEKKNETPGQLVSQARVAERRTAPTSPPLPRPTHVIGASVRFRAPGARARGRMRPGRDRDADRSSRAGRAGARSDATGTRRGRGPVFARRA
eukprot:CAMPEP_0119356090 /NCGR_PEP_ID=MMETSP1334-20130426/4797_1 /TAXON_ID=127549 /ORGANISM="Calcidiscus leptoporus, Strain RCC1130" /LENGTH=113 /DNA_ID=CAMNT_0007370057 /DNA_START=270 /DNA_END=608 /DNA_ORIENTATION=+